MSTLVYEVIPADYVVKRVYVSSEISGTQSVKIGSQTNSELVVPLSAGVSLSVDLKGCMYNPTLAYSMLEDTPLYLTVDGHVDGVVKIMFEIESLNF
jgi:hypothetical protein